MPAHCPIELVRETRGTLQAGEMLSAADRAWNDGKDWVWIGEMKSRARGAAVQVPVLMRLALTQGPPQLHCPQCAPCPLSHTKAGPLLALLLRTILQASLCFYFFWNVFFFPSPTTTFLLCCFWTLY